LGILGEGIDGEALANPPVTGGRGPSLGPGGGDRRLLLRRRLGLDLEGDDGRDVAVGDDGLPVADEPGLGDHQHQRLAAALDREGGGRAARRMPSSAVTSAPEGSVEIFTETFSLGAAGGSTAGGSVDTAGTVLFSASGSGGSVATFCSLFILWRVPTSTA